MLQPLYEKRRPKERGLIYTPLKELLTSYPTHHAGDALGEAPSGHVQRIAPVARQASARKARERPPS